MKHVQTTLIRILLCIALGVSLAACSDEASDVDASAVNAGDAVAMPVDDADPMPDPDVVADPDPDTASPVLTIAAPVDGFETPAQTVRVRGSATDNVGVTRIMVGLVGQPATEVFNSASGVPSASFDQFVNLPEGSFTVTATAFDAAGNSASQTRTVRRTAVADEVVARIVRSGGVTAGEPTLFDGSGSTGDGTLRYDWDFGDGRTGGGARIGHIYTAADTYTVTLLVTDSAGNTDQVTETVQIDAGPVPVANNGRLRVSLVDMTDTPVAGGLVAIAGSDDVTPSNAEGIALLDGVTVGLPINVVVDATGFASQFVATRIPAGGEEAALNVRLLARAPAQTLQRAEAGGTVSGASGVAVTLPADALVDSDGNPVSGDIEVALTPLDVSDDTTLEAFPGGFAAIDVSGETGALLSLGLAEFDLRQDGQPLNLAPGATATLRVPIYVTELDDGTPVAAGVTIPLWSLDETTGDWVQEGTGTAVADAASPTGFAFEAEVSHFSWWNCDVFETTYELAIRARIDEQTVDPSVELNDVTVSAGATTGLDGPRSRAQTTITAAGLSLIFPDVDVVVRGFANAGTLVAEPVVIPAGTRPSEIVLIMRPQQAGATRVVPVDVPADETDAIDNFGDAIEFTFDAVQDQIYSVAVSSQADNGLAGTVRVALPESAVLDGDFDEFQAFRGDSIAAASGQGVITVVSTSENPGSFSLQVTAEDLPNAVLELGQPQTIELTPDNPTARFTVDTPVGAFVEYVARPQGAGVVSLRVLPGVEPVQAGQPGVRNRAAFEVRQAAQDQSVVELELTSSAADTIEIRAATVPVFDFDTEVTGTITRGDSRFWRLPPTESVQFASIGLAGSAQVRAEIQRLVDVQAIQAGNLTRNPFAYDTSSDYILRVSTGSADGDFTFAVANIEPAAPLVLSGSAVQAGAALETLGDIQFYQLDVPSGTGVDVRLRSEGAAPIGDGGDLVLFRTATPGDLDRQRSLTQVTPQFRSSNAPETTNIRSQFGLQLNREASETWLLAVHNQSFEGTGDYVLDVAVAVPAASHVVDDDGADCSDASTPSLLAANFAVNAGGTITLCSGRYEHLVEIRPQVDGLSLVADGEPLVVHLNGEPAITRNNVIGNLLLDGLSFESSTSQVLELGAGATARNLTVAGAPGANVGINVVGDDVTLDSITFSGLDRLVRVFGAEGFRLLNSVASNGQSRIEVQRCDDCEVTGNTIESQGSTATVMDVSGTVFAVSGNSITATNNSGLLLAVEAEQPATAGRFVISDNRFETTGSGINLEVEDVPAQIIFERNRVVQALASPRSALVVTAARPAGTGGVLVRNNSFDGVVGSAEAASNTAIQFNQTQAGLPFEFVNNSVRSGGVDPGGSGALLRIASPDSGSVGVRIFNNIFRGADGFTGDPTGVQTDPDITIDADYNLFHNFSTLYAGGTSAAGPNDTVGDPLFTDDSLAVDATSPAVDTGLTPMAGAPAIPDDDIDGNARPIGSGYDRGAHEQ